MYSESWLNWNKDSLNSEVVRCLAEIKLAVCCYYRYNFGQGCLELGEFQTAEIESFFKNTSAYPKFRYLVLYQGGGSNPCDFSGGRLQVQGWTEWVEWGGDTRISEIKEWRRLIKKHCRNRGVLKIQIHFRRVGGSYPL